MKTFAGKSHVVAHHVSKIQSLNELIAHSIECVHASISIRKQGDIVCLIEYLSFDIEFLISLEWNEYHYK